VKSRKYLLGWRDPFLCVLPASLEGEKLLQCRFFNRTIKGIPAWLFLVTVVVNETCTSSKIEKCLSHPPLSPSPPVASVFLRMQGIYTLSTNPHANCRRWENSFIQQTF